MHAACRSQWLAACASENYQVRCPACRRSEDSDTSDTSSDSEGDSEGEPDEGCAGRPGAGADEMEVDCGPGMGTGDRAQGAHGAGGDDVCLPSPEGWAAVLSSAPRGQWGRVTETPLWLLRAVSEAVSPGAMVAENRRRVIEDPHGDHLATSCFSADRDGIVEALARARRVASLREETRAIVLAVDVSGAALQTAEQAARTRPGPSTLLSLAAAEVSGPGPQCFGKDHVVRV